MASEEAGSSAWSTIVLRSFQILTAPARRSTAPRPASSARPSGCPGPEPTVRARGEYVREYVALPSVQLRLYYMSTVLGGSRLIGRKPTPYPSSVLKNGENHITKQPPPEFEGFSFFDSFPPSSSAGGGVHGGLSSLS